MIDASGHLKLIDFGLSKIVSTSQFGNPHPAAAGPPMPDDGLGGGAGGRVGAEAPAEPGLGGGVGPSGARTVVDTALDLVKKVLPLKSYISAPQSDPDQPLSLPAFTERSVHLLLIDFNVLSANTKRLREMYFKVTGVSSLAAAQQLLDKGSEVEVVLVDLDSVNMTDPTATMGHALSIIEVLFRSVKKRHVPLLGLSSIDDHDLQRRFMAAGVREVLHSPLHKTSRDILLKYGRLYRHMSTNNTAPVKRVDPKYKGNHGLGLPAPRSQQNPPSRISHLSSNTGILQPLPLSQVGLDSATQGVNRPITTARTSQAPLGYYMGPGNTAYPTQTNPLGVAAGEHQSHSAVGTIHFMAPEMIFERRYGRSVDWWACGVTFYACTLREHLFNGADKDAIFQSILSASVDLSKLGPHSPLLQELVEGLLVRDPSLRLGAEGAHHIMRHEFFLGIDWETVSETTTPFKPPDAPPRRNQHTAADKRLFYGQQYQDPGGEVKSNGGVGNRTKDHRTQHDRRGSSDVFGREGGADAHQQSVSEQRYNRLPKVSLVGVSNSGLGGSHNGSISLSVSKSRKKSRKLSLKPRVTDFYNLIEKRKIWVSGEHIRPRGGDPGRGGFSVSDNSGSSYRNSYSQSYAALFRSGRLSSGSMNWSSLHSVREEDERSKSLSNSHSKSKSETDTTDSKSTGGSEFDIVVESA